jgi:flagellar FliJ protein
VGLHFQFSLQKVLDLRSRLEQEAAVELSRLQTVVAEAKGKLASQEIQRRAQLHAWRDGIQGELDISKLGMHQRRLVALDEIIAQQQTLIKELQIAAEQQRAEYLAARRKRKTLEKLRESEWAKFQQELLGKEQRELDDVASTRFIRREVLTS